MQFYVAPHYANYTTFLHCATLFFYPLLLAGYVIGPPFVVTLGLAPPPRSLLIQLPSLHHARTIVGMMHQILVNPTNPSLY